MKRSLTFLAVAIAAAAAGATWYGQSKLPVRDGTLPLAGLQALHRWGVPVSLLQSGMQAVELMPLVEARPAVLKLSAEWLHASQDGDGPHARAVKALAAVGAAQGFVLAVEGVDTAGLREVAARLGCRQAQGALFDGAVPAAEAERWLA